MKLRAVNSLEPRSVRKGINGHGVAHRGIARSLKYLRKHCGKPITVVDLARVSGLSTRGFHNAFIKHVGCSPGRMLRHVRLQRARRLLARSRLNLKSVAARSGYRKPNSFWIAFRKNVGVSPKKFQNRVRTSHAHSHSHSQSHSLPA
jgi:transcriptional regulator GlxA family with amidase domain